jgi:glycerate dehydrogenase
MSEQRPKVVVVNAGRLDWDGALDWAQLEATCTVVRHTDSSPSPAELAARCDGATVVVTKEVGVDVHLLPVSVRLICEAGTGYNNIDLAAAAARGITVCNVPAYSTEAVAQLVVTLMLSLSCSLTQQAQALARGDRRSFTQALSLPHFELEGKTILLIGGSGTIGQRVATLASSLGMRVLSWGRRTETPLAVLLGQADFVSIHIPLSGATHHLMGKAALASMKKGSYLINTARGPIVNETALIDALRSGHLAGAGLDVQETEPPAQDSPLWETPNLILTPHIGWKRVETRQRLIDALARNVQAWAKGEPINVVCNTV